jgi:hypothetical protein
MKRISETEHNNIVKDAVDFLKSNGYGEIKADISGYIQPNKITWEKTGQGHIPDVTARNGQLKLFEVETADSISHTHTADQWKLFDAFANQHGAEFWVVVPEGNESKANTRLAQLGIQAKVWEL